MNIRASRRRLPFGRWWLAGLLLAALLVAVLGGLNRRGEAPLPEVPTPLARTPQLVERGAYLARAGHCAGCHTARGGADYAGGRAVETPFGTVYASNLTPDVRTGIGGWSPDHFWRALHNGRSKDGRLLSPAFPYPSYTQVRREDADAIYAYLQSLPAVEQANRPHALRFPYGSPWAVAVWRALFFEPGAFVDEPQRSAEWNRGAYLVRGLGHCSACHAGRNALGGSRSPVELGGGLIPMQNWYAPSLSDPREAGVAAWPTERVVELLKTGRTEGASVSGPMAAVVFGSTQHLTEADLRSMAVFLRALPPSPGPPPRGAPASGETLEIGRRLYARHCAECHGDGGEGVAGAYPALAGNRAVTMASPVNLIRMVQSGGFPPSTAGHPRPHGMPPYSHVLNDAETAAVVSAIRASWGNQAPAVTPLDVLRSR